MSLVNSLPEYVEQKHDELLRSAVLGSESAKMFRLQTGVKTKSALNILNTAIQFQDGSACGFNAQGTSTISQREIEAPIVKVNMEFCDKELLNSALQHEVRVAAGQKTLPFENEFVADIMAQIDNGVERMIWQGDKVGKSEDNVLKWTDGILTHLNAEDGITKPENKLTHSGANIPDFILDAVDKVVLAIPTPILNKAVIWMGYDYFRAFCVAMKNANLFHYNGDGVDNSKVYYPGSNIMVKAVAGLDGTGTIVAADPENFVFGCDMQHDAEKCDLWYSKDDQVFKLAVEFGIGTQVAFPNEVVISTKGE